MKKKIIKISLFTTFIVLVAISISIGIINNKTVEMKTSKISKIEASNSETYTIIFDENGGDTSPSDMTSDGGNVVISSVIPKKSGYAFIQWKVRGSNVTVKPGQTFYNVKDYANSNKELIFEAQWGYLVTFDTNGGSWGPSDITLESGNITIPSDIPAKSGNSFIQWKVKGTNIVGRPNQTFYKVEDYVDNNGVLTFVADWGYKIIFDANGGLGAPSEMTSDGGNITIPSEVPERSGYTFLQWKVKDTNIAGRPNQTFYKVESYVDNDGILNFVADWGYEITYNTNGGLNTPSSQFKREGETITLSDVTPTKEGYKFLGWSTNSNATKATYTANSTFTENGNITLYAVWEKEKANYTITYDANGGTNKPENQTKQEGTSIRLSNVIPTRTGYKFLGWSKNSNGTTATYTANSTFAEDGNITLYAVWEKEKSSTDITNTVIDNTISNVISNNVVNNTTNTIKNDVVNNTTNNTIKNDVANNTTDNTIKNDVSENNISGDNTVKDDDSDENIIDDNTIDEKNSIISGKDDETKNKVEKNTLNASNPDNTKSKTSLPKAGMNTLKSVIILVVIISLIFGFKYKSTKLS